MSIKDLARRLGVTNDDSLIFLGSAEAEAEALSTSQISLMSVYVDFHNLISEISTEKFIFVGKKGAGKSAFAEYLLALSESEPNLFCKFIRQGEARLEHIVQIGASSGHPIERENLYKWIILTNILKLFSDNQAVQNNKDYSQLSQFLKKNAGFIEIRESEIKGLIEKKGFDIDIEYLKRFLRSKYSKTLEIHKEKAPFYKLLPDLEEVLLKVLMSHEEQANKNSYLLFFDDLDIDFNSADENTIKAIVSLIRITKSINNDLFAKNGLESKVVILLREDIKN